MHFSHASEIWNDYPELVPGVLATDRITADVDVRPRLAKFAATTESRLSAHSEAHLSEIQAWRRVFTRMGLKPTQYRCASESLLRRFRKEHALPRIHPLVDLCNAASMAFAIPVAVFDVSKITDYVEVRYADGSEIYESFSGDRENPYAGEVIFADGAGRAHARRWTNRQSGYSAVGADAASVLIVAEAFHASAQADVQRLVSTIAEELETVWSATPTTKALTSSSPRFEF